MTKKSYARQQRDEMKKNNRCWDDLNAICGDVKVLLYQHTTISSLASNMQLMSFLKDPSSTASSIKILARDLDLMNKRFQEIKSKHEGKTGGSLDPDVAIECIMINQEYAQLIEEHYAVIQPNVLKILEDINYAEKLYEAKIHEIKLGQQNNNSNTNVIEGESTTIPEEVK